MKRYKCALSTDSVDSLPVKRDKDGKPINIKSRPQENPMCVSAYGGFASERGGRKVALPMRHSEVYADTSENGIKEYVRVAEYQREYDNPDKSDTVVDVNGKLQWANVPEYSNFHTVLDYVGILNNPDNRRKAYKHIVAVQYGESLLAANLCYSCKKPVKTAVAKIAYGERINVFRDTIIADVKSHYEIRRNTDTGKFVFVYIDGTGRTILSRRGKYGQSEFYLAESGEVVYPASEYRVERHKCRCGLK